MPEHLVSQGFVQPSGAKQNFLQASTDGLRVESLLAHRRLVQAVFSSSKEPMGEGDGVRFFEGEAEDVDEGAGQAISIDEIRRKVGRRQVSTHLIKRVLSFSH